jgi:hypothetical protein
LVFSSSFFSGSGAASFIGSAAGASGAGAGSAAGGGGGGAGSSFLPQPTIVRVKANRVTTDNDIHFFRILSHLLSRRLYFQRYSIEQFLLHNSI